MSDLESLKAMLDRAHIWYREIRYQTAPPHGVGTTLSVPFGTEDPWWEFDDNGMLMHIG